MNLLITGTSSGLGYGLAEEALSRGWQVYGCSRRRADLNELKQVQCDLTDYSALPAAMEQLLQGVDALDLVILNAGILGRMAEMCRIGMDEVKQVMEVNLWANKAVMDWLCQWGRPIDQIIMISSGASVLGNKGWNAYSISKAALNMMAKLYAHETAAHITALAPGIIDTPMMDQLCEQSDAQAFPALKRLQAARATMPKPREVAQNIFSILDDLKRFDSGSFVDIRQLLDPDGYRQLYQK